MFCTTATPLKRMRVGNRSAVTNANVPLTNAPAQRRHRHQHDDVHAVRLSAA
jgi:hypothetical protein